MKTRKITSPAAGAALVCALLLSCCSSPAWAGRAHPQHERDPYALLFGTVYGPDNRPVYGVRIEIRRADHKKPKWETFSNHEGEFAQRVPAGKADYIVIADVKTPKHQPKPEITIHVENEERKDFSLHLK